MKRIAIFTMGTRGDIQPYIFLAQALTEAGHQVLIGTHPCWRDLIDTSKLTFQPIGPDIDIEDEASSIRYKNKNPAISMLKTMNFVFRIIQNSGEDILNASRGKDLIIVSHSQIGATEAEALGIKKIHVTLQTEAIPRPLKPSSLKDRIIGSLIGQMMVRPYNKIRRNYSLPPLKSSDDVMGNDLNLIPISKWVISADPYWSSQNHLTGYWYKEDADYSPPPELANFLAQGEKPIILSLGAMAFENEKDAEKLKLFLGAFEATKTRALIQGFRKSIAGLSLPDSVMAIGSVPHSWLFPQAFAVIQHCGFGTASASLIYGVPSIPVPHILDQFGFALQLESLGVAVPAIPARELTEARLVAAIMEMRATYDEKSRKAHELSEKIKAEDGLGCAINLIEAVLAND